MTAKPTCLRQERRADVLWLQIDRPERRNALSRVALGEIGAAFERHAGDETLKAVVIRGAGEEAFAAGGDLKELASLRAAEEVGEFFDHASRALDQVRAFPLPVVAALNGTALGGGAELAMACDLRIAAPHASIGYVQARLAICCGFGGGADLARRFGAGGALRLGLEARTLAAQDARAAGLVDEVVEPGESLEACVERALAPMLRHPPQVLRAYKAIALAERLGLPADQRRVIEREWFTRTWIHPDHWTALDAMTKKKPETPR